MTQIRAVIFDLGHTVWDFAPREDVRRLNALRLHLKLREALGDAVPSPDELDMALIVAISGWMKRWDSDSLEQPPSEELVREALTNVDLAVPNALLQDLTFLLFGREVDVPVIEPGTLAAFGQLERRDVLGAIAYVQCRGIPSTRISLLCHSMGAATCLLGAGEELDMAGVVADSSYTRLTDLLAFELPKASGLASFFNPSILLMGKLIYGFDPTQAAPKKLSRRKSRQFFSFIERATRQSLPSIPVACCLPQAKVVKRCAAL